MIQDNNQAETSKESFNKFIESNPEELRTIISMYTRLKEYGRFVLQKTWNEIKDKQFDGVRPIGDNIFAIRIKNNKCVAVEIHFDEHKLRWIIRVFSRDWIANEFNAQETRKENSVEIEHEVLKKYAKSIGILKDNDPSQKISDKDKNLWLCHILPSGNMEKDKQKIEEKVKPIVTALAKGKSQGEISSDVETPNYSEDWAKLCSDYQKANLLDKPEEIPTFLEIARINDKEVNISNVLAFFLNPDNPHPFGDIFCRALYNLYKDKSTEDKKSDYKEDTEISYVRTEKSTSNRKRIDLFVVSDKFVIAIENKIDAGLYNPLNDYRKHAEELAKEDLEEGQDPKELILIVLSPYGQDTTSADGWESITYKDLNREVILLLSENNWSLYHKDKHYLYMNLFHDLFKTVENRTYDHDTRDKFRNQFLVKPDYGYACRQAIHNLFSYREDILKDVESVIKEEWSKRGWLLPWRNPDYNSLKYYMGKDYADERVSYLMTHIMVYDTQNHRITKDKSTFTIHTFLDMGNGTWNIELWFKVTNNPNWMSVLNKYVHDEEFLMVDYLTKNDHENRLTAEIKPQGSKEKTQELLTDILTDIIQKIQ